VDPNVTARPADKMTAEEWRAQREDQRRKDAMHEALKVRLAWYDAHPHENCQSCFKRFPVSGMTDGLCAICGAWAASALRRLEDREATRRLKVQLAAMDLLAMFDRMPAISDFRSADLCRVNLRPFEEMRWLAATA